MHVKGVGSWPGFNWLTTETDGKATKLRIPDEAEDLIITCSTVHLEDLDVDGGGDIIEMDLQEVGSTEHGLDCAVSG